MSYRYIKICTTAALLTSMSSYANSSTNNHKDVAPNFYGHISARVIDQQDGRDTFHEAYDVRVGVKGKKVLKEIGMPVLYQLEAEITNAVNGSRFNSDDDNELQVTEAKVAFGTPYGILLLAPKAVSGYQKDLYGPVDVFETNEAHAVNGVSDIFAQDQLINNAIGYITPANSLGLRAVLAHLGGADNNNENNDILTWRVTWEGEKTDALSESYAKGLKLGIGQVYIDEALPAQAGLPVTDEWVRTTFMASFDKGGLHLGATYEDNDYKNDANIKLSQSNYGVVASYTMDGWTASVGQYKRDIDGTDIGDNEGTVFGLKKQFKDGLMLFVEHGNFDIDSQDSTTAGVKFSF